MLKSSLQENQFIKFRNTFIRNALFERFLFECRVISKWIRWAFRRLNLRSDLICVYLWCIIAICIALWIFDSYFCNKFVYFFSFLFVYLVYFLSLLKAELFYYTFWRQNWDLDRYCVDIIVTHCKLELCIIINFSFIILMWKK